MSSCGRRWAAHPGGAQAYLREKNPLWRLVGRVTFHLAENKRDAAASVCVHGDLRQPAVGAGAGAASAAGQGAAGICRGEGSDGAAVAARRRSSGRRSGARW